MKISLPLLLALMFCPLAAAEFPFRGCFDLASRRHNIDLDLLLAVASVESNWDADARSSANAHGVMQIRWPLTARHLGSRRVAELYNPCLNIDLGAQYLRELSDRYAGDNNLVLAAYNYGPTRIRNSKDIPAGVLAYVRKVETHRERISRKMNNAVMPGLLSKETIEVIRFNHRFRARLYLQSLKKHVPGAKFTLEEHAGKNIIYLDAASLTPESRYRLTQLIPGA